MNSNFSKEDRLKIDALADNWQKQPFTYEYDFSESLRNAWPAISTELQALELEIEVHRQARIKEREEFVSLQSQLAQVQRQNEVLLKALENCCEREPDGHGDYVAEEFETKAVLDGRKVLAQVGKSL